MKNRSSVSSNPHPYFLSDLSIHHFARPLPPCLYHLLHLSFFFFPPFFLPVPTGCINANSHMLQAERQLSLLSQSDGPGHTSGNPWQGSPLPRLLHHPPLYGAEWIDIVQFTPPEKTKAIQNQNNEWWSVFHLGAEQRLHVHLLKSNLNESAINIMTLPVTSDIIAG